MHSDIPEKPNVEGLSWPFSKNNFEIKYMHTYIYTLIHCQLQTA